MSLYDIRQEKDSCGFGLIAHLSGTPSHKLVRTAVASLARMSHRGAIGSDGKTGDGCGVLLQKPDSFFQTLARENQWSLADRYGVGVIFSGHLPEQKEAANRLIEKELARESLTVAGWRDVPVQPEVLGKIAGQSRPMIRQVLINAPFGWGARDLERRLYIVRRRIEKNAGSDPDFYICSFSGLVVVYKGLCQPADLSAFFPDLADLRLTSAICLFHQRFSTNTLPRWPLAQPFRYLAHNGELNTISGNRQWAKARAYKIKSPLLPDMEQASPFVNETGSDSSALDNMLELFLAGGMDLFRVFRLLIPPAWQRHPDMDDDLKAFYDFNSMHMEPWDGPAGIVMSDGRFAACGLDRNGLRPARYVVTKDDWLTVASEVGIWDYQPDEVLEKGRLAPGELLVVDTLAGKKWVSWEIDRELKSRHPYRKWMDTSCRFLEDMDAGDTKRRQGRQMDEDTCRRYHKIFGWSDEEIRTVIRGMGNLGKEPVSSMGDDTPMAVLSRLPRSLFDYFRQMFAQVTNPPIDSLRERHVMSLATIVGRERNVFNETRGHAWRVLFPSPVLLEEEFQKLCNLDPQYYRHTVIDINYDPEIGLEKAVCDICEKALSAVKNRTVLVVLSDRGVIRQTLPVPVAMAVGAVQQALVENNHRCDANIIVETAAVRDPHHFAVLLGLGATAIFPYLACETLAQLSEAGSLAVSLEQAILNYREGINNGILKIMSKMGISTVASYRCARLFEVVGMADEVVDLCFKGMASRISGAVFGDFQADQAILSHMAWEKPFLPISRGGLYKYVHGHEFHDYHPEVVQTLQQAVNFDDMAAYRRYSAMVNQRPVTHLRDLLQLKKTGNGISEDAVAPETEFFKRFDTAAMSIGALSPEAHEALAVAMNRIGGYSNSGEGGEDPARYHTEKVSRIKQVASGRFGVTPSYLMSADVIQIKMAQGAKPGEGGQLPGHKVSALIAGLRFATPGVTLISPPPHHDIYSIEDLAQLIFDLKQVNPEAMVSVKLVSAPGVGTIATGVAKAYADLITISGYDGGTGASPLTSVKYAGSPWELGLAETHQALVENGLRHKVRLQVDGGLKTGLDIVKAAILGAESFGFGTGPLISLGCKYLRICHLNNCATGVATQDEVLRKKHFAGLPEKVIRYFSFMVRETREIMACLGISSLYDLIGRTDLLEIVPGHTAKQKNLDLAALLASPEPTEDSGRYCCGRNHPVDPGRLNQTLKKDFGQAIEKMAGGSGAYAIRNSDRSVGALLSGMIAGRYGNPGVAAAPVTLCFDGTAGQSFGAFNAGGLHMVLTGDANDYVGKGMAGGKLVLRPPVGVSYKSHEAVIMGNTCLYGATGGKLYAAGRAGERFAVRNSGAHAVVEGIGDNGCEYMTGGVVAILGPVGVNFGAGMTGGFAYVLDNEHRLDHHLNKELVQALSMVDLPVFQEHLRGIVNTHYEETGSMLAEQILSRFDHHVEQFKLVKPKSTELASLLGHRGNRPEETLRVAD